MIYRLNNNLVAILRLVSCRSILKSYYSTCTSELISQRGRQTSFVSTLHACKIPHCLITAHRRMWQANWLAKTRINYISYSCYSCYSCYCTVWALYSTGAKYAAPATLFSIGHDVPVHAADAGAATWRTFRQPGQDGATVGNSSAHYRILYCTVVWLAATVQYPLYCAILPTVL